MVVELNISTRTWGVGMLLEMYLNGYYHRA